MSKLSYKQKSQIIEDLCKGITLYSTLCQDLKTFEDNLKDYPLKVPKKLQKHIRKNIITRRTEVGC